MWGDYMPAVSAIIQHGNIPASTLVDESNSTTPDVLVQSLTISATRESKEYKAAGGYVFAVEERNPVITFAFDGYVSVKDGLADEHPGTAVTSLANFTESTFGFAPGDGTLIYRNPVRTETIDELAKVTFDVVQMPFVS